MYGRPCHVGFTSCHLNTESTQHSASNVLGWVTTTIGTPRAACMGSNLRILKAVVKTWYLNSNVGGTR